MTNKKKITIICGGPSAERGISINSARSLYDNLNKNKYEISIIYYNPKLEAYKIGVDQIYSNTPQDFDYLLKHKSKPLTTPQLQTALKKADKIFPAIHGTFGEDGKLQTILEKTEVKYTGSPPRACANTANKHLCQQILSQNGFFTIQGTILTKGSPLPILPAGKYIIKPLHGGSSLGVNSFNYPIKNKQEIRQKLNDTFKHERKALIEPFITGKEFTIIVLQNKKSKPVALLPTEIEFTKKENNLFNYRKKYLATAETRYHTPARFSNETIKEIRQLAQKAFTTLQMKDFARLDGWVKEDGTIWFSDINAISGMEQNSFLFQQAAILGLSHSQLLDYILNKTISDNDPENAPCKIIQKDPIPVIFGGKTAEKQVSVMSGTNVWIKLKASTKYIPIPLFLTQNNKIFHIPQFLCLHHTVEEIEEKIAEFQSPKFIKKIKQQQREILNELEIDIKNIEEQIFSPHETTLKNISKTYSFLFLGLHGGENENGTLQSQLDKLKFPYNGSNAQASQICMNKHLTGLLIEKSQAQGIQTATKVLLQLNSSPQELWNSIKANNLTPPLIIKPNGDGCSAGVIKIWNKNQFIKVIKFFNSRHPHIPEKEIHPQHGQIDLPHEKLTEILVEEFIETDKIAVKDLKIKWVSKTDIIEVTVGVIGKRNNMKALYPSQSIASQNILSLEEKFMGGTGINLTPPPSEYVHPQVIKKVMANIEKVAQILNLENYARIDAFMNIKTGEITVIEVNTLPALTPSTVLFQQALSGIAPLTPLHLLEHIIESGKQRFQNSPPQNL